MIEVLNVQLPNSDPSDVGVGDTDPRSPWNTDAAGVTGDTVSAEFRADADATFPGARSAHPFASGHSDAPRLARNSGAALCGAHACPAGDWSGGSHSWSAGDPDTACVALDSGVAELPAGLMKSELKFASTVVG